jgi:DNA-binding NtrC family response regulator
LTDKRFSRGEFAAGVFLLGPPSGGRRINAGGIPGIFHPTFPPMAAPASGDQQIASSPKWVLVVDDEVGIFRIITESLSAEPLEVVHAKNAKDALAVVDQRKTEPLLVFLDVLMPGMDGLTLARKLGGKLKRSKIAIMSGHMTDLSWWPDDLREVEFLTKPFRVHDVMTLLDSARTEYDLES